MHSNPTLKILLIEDSSSHATLFKLSLDKALNTPHEIDHAHSLTESFQLLATNSYNIVVIDLGLPESFGLDTVNRFFAEAGPDHAVIVLTASDEEGIGEEALRMGTLDFLVKGRYGADHLARCIRHSLERWRQRNELEQAREDLKSFAHAAAHDLRSPVTSISAYASILQDNLDTDIIGEENKEFLDQIVFLADQAERLTTALLNFSVLGNKALVRSNIDPKVVAQHSVADLPMEFEESMARIKIDDLPEVNADPDLLEHVFQNLIGNGIKYRSQSAPEIHISGTRVHHEVIFSVSDNGVGIDPKLKDKVFEPFKRLPSAGASDGFGLGLAICQRIVEAHQGRIWVDSTEGTGSIFRFSIPAAQANAPTLVGEVELDPALN